MSDGSKRKRRHSACPLIQRTAEATPDLGGRHLGDSGESLQRAWVLRAAKEVGRARAKLRFD
jgi:hypothetical protein